MNEDIRKILEIAIHAPSGENCQPWRFRIKDNQIFIFNIPERDLSLYNFKQTGSFVAHGALVENIVIASSAFGYTARLNMFPSNDDSNLVAIVALEKSSAKQEPLYSYITKRMTNRKPYETISLTSEQKNTLLKSADEIGEGEVRFVEDRQKISTLAKALTVSDLMLFENRKLHNFLFGHISWTEEEAKNKKSGFYIKELALAPPQEKAFKLFKNWNILNIFNKIGFSKIAAKSNAKLYASTAAIGVIIMIGNSPKDFLMAGRLMERVWLKATKMGLSIQPVTGVIFFMQRIFGGEAQDFSAQHIELVKTAYEKITSVFGLKKGTIAMLFRIGNGGSPSVRSLRLAPEISIE